MKKIIILLSLFSIGADYAPKNRPDAPKNRSGVSLPYTGGSLTKRSDGSSSYTRPFGSGSITTEKDKSGKTTTGMVKPFGNGTTTQWNNGAINRNNGSFNLDSKK